MQDLIISEQSWSLGVKLGLPIAIVLFFICFLATLFFFVVWIKDKAADYGILVAIGAISTLLVMGISAWAFYPYEKEYHQWNGFAGTVEQVDKRILPAGDGAIKERVLIEIEGKGQYGCDDTRCVGLKRGDLISLTCKKEWQYSGTDGWACNYVDSRQVNNG